MNTSNPCCGVKEMETAVQTVVPIAFGKRVLNADTFMSLFNEGMGLVEDTAQYLDGEGRKESRELSRNDALAYSTNSMVLTTRLMQMASWLLLHRALREGELNEDQAREQASDNRMGAWIMDEEIHAGLPDYIVDLIERSQSLARRIISLHTSLYGPVDIVDEPATVSQRVEDIRKLYDTGEEDGNVSFL